MKITSLTLKNFRNVVFEKIEFADGINVLAGKNAQGKTNILEAIGYCSYLKSFRSVRDDQLINFKADSAKITLEFEKNGEKNRIDVEIFRDRPKELRLGGLSVSRNRELIGVFLSIIFTPDQLELIKEGPNKRRSFLDMAICATDVRYTDSLLRYQKVLLQRNALLKKISEQGADPLLLDVYDKKLAEEGSYIAFKRDEYIKALEPHAKRIFKEMSGGEGSLKLLYINQFTKKVESRAQLESEMLRRFAAKRNSDIEAQITGSGVQKDDMLVLNGGKSLKFYGSQGQIRTAVISLILAQSEVVHEKYGVYPVVVLDDILSELDRTRRKYVLENRGGAQCIISTCETAKFKSTECKVFKVRDGRII